MSDQKLTPETLREWAWFVGRFMKLAVPYEGDRRDEQAVPPASAIRSHADEWDEQVRTLEAKVATLDRDLDAALEDLATAETSAANMNRRLRHLWYAVVDGDMDRLSAGYELKDMASNIEEYEKPRRSQPSTKFRRRRMAWGRIGLLLRRNKC